MLLVLHIILCVDNVQMICSSIEYTPEQKNLFTSIFQQKIDQRRPAWALLKALFELSNGVYNMLCAFGCLFFVGQN